MTKFKVGDKVKTNKGEYLTIYYYSSKDQAYLCTDDRWFHENELQLVTPIQEEDLIPKDQITLLELLTDPKYTKPGYKFQCFGEDMTMDTQGLLFFQDREVRFHLSQGLLKTIVTITQRPEKHYCYYDGQDHYWSGTKWVHEKLLARVYTEKEVEAYKAVGIPTVKGRKFIEV